MAEEQYQSTMGSGSGDLASTVQAYASRFDTVSVGLIYNSSVKLCEKLEKAMSKGELERFLQERRGYRQRYGFLNSTNRSLRALCICIALNAYSSEHPDFVPKLSEAITRVIRSGKRTKTAAFTVAQQWAFQIDGTSDLPLVDRQLREDTIVCLKNQKKLTLLLGLLLLFAPTFLVIGLGMNNVEPDKMLFLFPILAVTSIWGLLKLVSLAAISGTVRILRTEPALTPADPQQGSGQT